MSRYYDVIIVGSGPAGLTAGLYTSRAGLATLIIESETIGGGLMARDLIENYPGQSDGIMGPQLGSQMVRQVANYGTRIQVGAVEQIEIGKAYRVVRTSSGEYRCKALIVASGAHPRQLGVPGEKEFTGKGVFSCATCDGPRFADKVVAVAGGGDSGITEALFLARMAARVVVIELLPTCKATGILLERASSNPKIEIRCGVRIEAIRGDDRVKSLDLRDGQTGRSSVLEADGVLVHIGVAPNTAYLRGTLPLHDNGQILVNEILETGVPGIFAAGDVRHNSPLQIATAVGDGATAALSLLKYLDTAKE